VRDRASWDPFFSLPFWRPINENGTTQPGVSPISSRITHAEKRPCPPHYCASLCLTSCISVSTTYWRAKEKKPLPFSPPQAVPLLADPFHLPVLLVRDLGQIMPEAGVRAVPPFSRRMTPLFFPTSGWLMAVLPPLTPSPPLQ